MIREEVRAAMRDCSAEKPVLTREEAARLLCVHPGYLGRLARRGEVPAVKVGTHWRFRREDLLAWLGQHATDRGARTARHGATLRAVGG